MTKTDTFEVSFWGVRGSIPCPGPDTLRYGGNTPCVEVRCGDRVLIFDAGTGIRLLGAKLIAADIKNADLFLSHTHYDHVLGLPFFCFAYDPRNSLRIWSGHEPTGNSIEQTLRRFMSPPLFPVSTDIFDAAITFTDFQAGDDLAPATGISVRTMALNHPDNCTGYRVDFGGKAVCYMTDTEHAAGKPDPAIMDFIRDADLVIYDSNFTDDEYQSYVGWGHSTWQEGVRLCQAAGVKTLALFHHSPERDDTALAAIETAAKKQFPGALAAREGLTLSL